MRRGERQSGLCESAGFLLSEQTGVALLALTAPSKLCFTGQEPCESQSEEWRA